MSKPWGGAGAWAADAERAEAEEKERLAADPESFPSIQEAAAAAKPKKKKMTLSLSEFTTGTYVGPGGGGKRDFTSDSRLTTDEMLRLPTGPKERSEAEIEQGRLAGGFRSYGRPRSDSNDGNWGQGGGGRRSYGGFDDDRRAAPPPKISEFDAPSRADEVDNWATTKKPVSFAAGPESGRNERYTGLGGGGGIGGSRADEVDNWAIGKKSLPAARLGGFGSGFRDSGHDLDSWNRAGGGREVDQKERPRLVLDPPKAGVGVGGGGVGSSEVVRSRPSPFGTARPREDVLAEMGLDWRKMEADIETKSSHSSRPSSSHSSRPQSPVVIEGASGRPRQRVNPFGDAKPREVLLEEKGKDWRKIDLELEQRGIERPETEEERILKEEINSIKEELAKAAKVNLNGEEHNGLRDQLLLKEQELELLIREFNDKVRFGQRATNRSGSGEGRVPALSERPSSRSSASEESRSVDYMERPQSHGTSDGWTKFGDDRRTFQGSRQRGFLGNRDIDR